MKLFKNDWGKKEKTSTTLKLYWRYIFTLEQDYSSLWVSLSTLLKVGVSLHLTFTCKAMQKYYGVKLTRIKVPIKSCVLLYSSVSQSEISSHPLRAVISLKHTILASHSLHLLISDKRCHFILLFNLINKEQWWKVYIILLTLLCSVKASGLTVKYTSGQSKTQSVLQWWWILPSTLPVVCVRSSTCGRW